MNLALRFLTESTASSSCAWRCEGNKILTTNHMKQLLLILVWSGSFFFSFSQDALTLDNRILGGGVSFLQRDSEDLYPFSDDIILDDTRNDSRIAYSFTPYFGRFYQDHKKIGLRFQLNGWDTESENIFDDNEYTRESSFRAVSLGGFLRQYFPFSDRFGVFLEEGIDFWQKCL